MLMVTDSLFEDFDKSLHNETENVFFSVAFEENEAIVLVERDDDEPHYVWASPEAREWWNNLNNGWHAVDAAYSALCDRVGDATASEIMDRLVYDEGVCDCDFEEQPIRLKKAIEEEEAAHA